jgi:hypothetical protein
VDKGASAQFVIEHAKAAADALEAANIAPWQPAPAQDAAEAVALLRRLCADWTHPISARDDAAMSDTVAYLARLDAANGGAT